MGHVSITLAEEEKIRKLRTTGHSIGEIASAIGRGKSTIAWRVKNIPVSQDYVKIWRSKIGGNQIRSQARWKDSKLIAGDIIGNVSERDMLIIAACLYWGEGNKKDFAFTNTDPRMIKTMVGCLQSLGVKKARLSITLRLYEDIDTDAAKKYWATIVGISPKDILGTNIIHGKKVGKLKYGMCRLRVKKADTDFKKLMSTIELIGSHFVPIAQRIELQTPKL